MSARGAAVALCLSTVVIGSCSGSPVVIVSPTQLSSAQIIAAGSPELRTLDNTGFVYPGGQTTEVSQGIGPAVVGRGGYLTPFPTHGYGPLPLPLPPPASPPNAGAPPSGDPVETVERVARALCDHETYCERIGPNGIFESADACSTEQRARLGGVVAKSSCEATVRGDLLADCLRDIRAAQCIVDADALSMPPSCSEALPSCS